MNSNKLRSIQKIPFILIMVVTLIGGCGGGSNGGENTAGAHVDEAQASDPGKMFDESIKEDKCSLLTPQQVAAAASVPESAVEKNRSLCLYEWEGANIYLSSVRVHDTIERASKYYDRNTKDFTAEEMRASKEKLKEEMRESETGAGISEALIDAAPEDAITYERWDDIGNEAAWDGNTTMIHYGNVTVKFSGKTYDRAEGEDWVAPEIAKAIASSIVANLDEAG